MIGSMVTLDLTMFGPSGCGKTSLLTAMWDRFEETVGKADLQINPDTVSNTAALLSRCRTGLINFVGSDGQNAMPPTLDPQRYTFALGPRGRAAAIRLHFQDYPGKYLEEEADEEEREDALSYVENSVAVLVAIDAVALMERKGHWHDERNIPDVITSYFRDTYGDLDGPRLVILAPVRCETYVRAGRGPELLRRVKAGYGRLLDFFESEPLQDKVAVIVTPVQTLGGMRLSDLDRKFYQAHFRKERPNSTFSPEDSEQPLRYLLLFLMRLVWESRRSASHSFFGPFVNLVRDLLGLDDWLRQAVPQFASGCKKSDGFAVLQGEHLLQLPGK